MCRRIAAPGSTATDFHVFDTTLRDGAQREGITYSVADKLAVARLLDELGVGFIEGGWPGAMPKDTEFFARARTELKLRARRSWSRSAPPARPASAVEDDPQVRALLDARDPGGLPGRQVRRPARRAGAAHHAGGEPGDGRRHRRASSSAEGRRVFLDCEHFFDGYAARPRLRRRGCCEAAFAAGADVGVLCDTNGGMLPMGVGRVVADVAGAHRRPARHPLPGRHRLRGRQHLAAVEAGATHVQCTANGYGERRRQRRPVRRRRQPG